MIAKIRHIIFIGLTALLFSCGTYYQKTLATEQALVVGNYHGAKEAVEGSKFLKRKRNSLLYALEMGKVLHLKGDFKESNKYLEYADYKMQEFNSIGDHAVGALVNQSMQTYRAEEHEKIMVHYYKALNYMQMGDVEEALVEARKINLAQQALNIAAKSKDHLYRQDPFGLMLMGMLYEADHDYNNAFIAYRNAKEVYDADQSGLFHLNKPSHLEQDIVRTAQYAGITYSSALQIEENYAEHGELILFWENGLSPVKNEKDMFFSLDQNNDGFFFASDGLMIPIDYNFAASDPDFDPGSVGLIRLARSYYVNRMPMTMGVNVEVNGQQQKLEMAQDISALAFQQEKENYLKDLGADLLRLTLKKISEAALKEADETAGTLLNIANFATEKADTRNWQSLPSQIQFARIPLKEGLNKVKVETSLGETIELEVFGTGRVLFRNVVTY